MPKYSVNCEECGRVSFEIVDYDLFSNKIAASYYAGYHDAKEHPESDRQLSTARELI